MLATAPERRTRPASVARLIGGRYRLLGQVGAGGMATVHRARDERLGRDVAVKLIAEPFAGEPVFVERFRRETELSARLVHPNIVATLDAGDDPRDFMVMELVEGLDAAALARARRTLSAGQTVHIVAHVCDALTHAHARGIVHRDVSPQNILLRAADGAVKLADFGLASADPRDRATRAEHVMGTPGYVAPEVLWGDAPSPASDLYALGVVAHRFLAGPPAGGPGDPAATASLATAGPRLRPLAEARPDLAPGLVAAVERAMARPVDARQSSVAEFRAQLLDALSAPSVLRRAWPPSRPAAPRALPNAA